jgi:hypothetical protein
MEVKAVELKGLKPPNATPMADTVHAPRSKAGLKHETASANAAILILFDNGHLP